MQSPDSKRQTNPAAQDTALIQTEPPTEDTPILDPLIFEEFRHMVGVASSELLQEMIDCYFEEAPRLIQVMQEALMLSDAVGLRRSAHTLKSSSAVLGATTLAQLCQNLETATASAIVVDATTSIAQIEAEYEKVRIALSIAQKT